MSFRNAYILVAAVTVVVFVLAMSFVGDDSVVAMLALVVVMIFFPRRWIAERLTHHEDLEPNNQRR